MDTKTNIAFKEWAVICKLLGEGRQILILRKGGIVEDAGEFQPEHREFFLFPTFVHEQTAGLKKEVAGELGEIEKTQVKPGHVPISLLATVTDTVWIPDLARLTALDAHHFWSQETVEKRFHYGSKKGLYILLATIYRLPTTIEIPLRDRYAGCKSWVPLETEIHAQNVTPVLAESDFEARRGNILTVLHSVSAQ